MPDRAPASDSLALRCSRALRSPWARLALLVVLLVCAAAAVMAWQPQQLMSQGWQSQASGGTDVVLFAAVYALCTAAFMPRPVLNVAAGALFGAQAGFACALAGTVLGAGLSFALGRALGREALRPLLRGRLITSLDRQLSEHGFRSVLVMRLFPGVPFAAANYAAALSRMRQAPFLLATALGSVPNTAAYVITGSRASSPTSPAFVLSTVFLVVTGLGAVAVAWRGRQRRAAPAPVPASAARRPALPPRAGGGTVTSR